jgi:hypothetical protein
VWLWSLLKDFLEECVKLISFLIVVIVLAFGNIHISQAQVTKATVAYQIDNVWYVLDNKGNELFQTAEVNEIEGYREGFILANVKDYVKRKTRPVFLNTKGEIAIKPDADDASYFFEGLACIFDYTDPNLQERISGYIDTSGKIIKAKIYKDALDFSEGLAYVMNDEERGYINTKGEMVLKMEQTVGYNFSEGIAPISNFDYKVAYMDKKGKLVLPYHYDEPHPFASGLAKITKNGKFGSININGEEVIPPLYDDIKMFENNRSFVAKYNENFVGKWALIDNNGKLLSDYIFTYAYVFSDSLACVKLDQNWGFINLDGTFAFPNSFTNALSFRDGLAWASIDGKMKAGYINKKGEYVFTIPLNAKKIIDLRFNVKVEY